MTIDRPFGVRPRLGADGGDVVLPRAPQPWITTIARLRRLCGPWLLAVATLAFLPGPMRAQPTPRARTAFRVTPDDPEKDLGASPERGDRAGASDTAPSGEASPESRRDGERTGPPPKLLVLKNGRLVEGRISQNAGGYVVDRPNGSLLVPFDRVSFEAQDKKDAYSKVRAKMPAKTAGSNLALARWCLTYNLFDEAESELRQALELEPYREEARTMLRRLEEIRNPDQPLHKETPKNAAHTDDGFALPEVESLGGLSKDAAQEFVARIQPILVNKCGNASCHGGSTPRSGFQLAPVREGRGSRTHAERNLATVLHYVDFQAPDQSPLLTVPRGTHGGSRAIYSGPRAGEQFETLRDWVRTAAKEEGLQHAARAARPSLAASTASRTERTEGENPAADRPVIVPASDDEFARPAVRFTSEPRRLPEPNNARPAAKGGAAAGSAGVDRVKKTLKEEQPDPFSPDEFNRGRTKN